jgi:probable HAF family extracellular repeat protein
MFASLRFSRHSEGGPREEMEMKTFAGVVQALFLGGSAFAGSFTFIALSDPNATGGTYSQGINSSGQIVGYYSDAAGEHGFSYNGSVYTALDNPNAVQQFGGTAAFGVNGSGQIVGTYWNGTGAELGFSYAGSTYSMLNGPGFDTAARGINDSGEIVGIYDDVAGQHGFLYDGSTYTTIDDPNAAPYLGIFRSSALGINNFGDVVGYYADAGGQDHGFIYDGSTWIQLDDPNAVASLGGTVAFGINGSGHVVGNYFDATGEHGFFFDGTTYTTLAPYAVATGINDSDQIAGFYSNQPVAFGAEPGTALLVLCGGAVAFWIKQRRQLG